MPTATTRLTHLRKTYKTLLTTVKTLEAKLLLLNEAMEQFEHQYHSERIKNRSKKARGSTKKTQPKETSTLQEMERLFEIVPPEIELF